MIKIKKYGNTYMEAKCMSCGCEFSYALTDQRVSFDEIGREYRDFVICPECKTWILLNSENLDS